MPPTKRKKSPIPGLDKTSNPLEFPPQPGARFTKAGYSTPVNREFNQDEMKTLNNFDAVKKHTGFLRNSMTSNPEGFKKSFIRANIPFAELGSDDALEIKFRINDTADRLLRLRSGAQINNQEFSRLRSLLPNLADISTGNFNMINRKLDLFDDEFSLARDRILGGSQFEEGRGISPIPGSPGFQDDRSSKLQRIKDRFKQRKP